MDVYKTKYFERWQKKSPVTDEFLCQAVKEMVEGIYDADLGQGLYKKRVAIENKGKRAGARTLLATNLDNKWFFVFGFKKSEKANIKTKEKEALQTLAQQFLALTEHELRLFVEDGRLLEICHG